jgi:hypothetical protein
MPNGTLAAAEVGGESAHDGWVLTLSEKLYDPNRCGALAEGSWLMVTFRLVIAARLLLLLGKSSPHKSAGSVFLNSLQSVALGTPTA